MSKIIATQNARIDVFLAQFCKQSRSQIAQLIKSKNVLVNEKLIKSSYILNIGDEISINYPEKDSATIKYESDFDIEIVYEDECMLVINKPAGVASHGCASLKEASLVEWLLERNYELADINGKIRAGIVHRLDKLTSGLMLVAKSNAAYYALANAIKNREVNRIYLAVINHEIKQKSIEKYIKRNENNRLKMRALSADECLKKYGSNQARWGKWAKTHFYNIASNDTSALISAKLESGRTHQIRAHLASINRYILGDPLYANAHSKTLANRMMLHSFYIDFTHPLNGKRLSFYTNNTYGFSYPGIAIDEALARKLLEYFMLNS